MRAISFYCELAQAAVLDGLQTEMMVSGGDAGDAVEAPAETALASEEAAAEEAPAEAEAAPAEAPAEAAAAKAPAEGDSADTAAAS